VVQFAAHGAKTGFDVAQTLAIGQLRKSHGQILVAAGEASVVRISAITLDALLKLVGGQVSDELGEDELGEDELGEDSLSGIHPSLSAMGVIECQSRLVPGPAAFYFKSKNESYLLSLPICDGYSERLDFSRTLVVWDNRIRMRSTLNYVIPMKFEQDWINAT